MTQLLTMTRTHQFPLQNNIQLSMRILVLQYTRVYDFAPDPPEARERKALRPRLGRRA